MALTDRNVLITGALSGIGLGLAEAFHAAGAHVFLTGRGPDRDGAADRLGERAAFLPLDVTEEKAWIAAIDAVVARRGSLDVLVNAAGAFRPGIAFEDMPLDIWREHFAVNVDGSFLGCKHAMRAMRRTGGGSIINFSSGLAHIALPDAAAYCVSKASTLALTRVAAKAGGPHQVRVNAILPGVVDTPMFWGNLREGQDPQDLLDIAAPGKTTSVSGSRKAFALASTARAASDSGTMWALSRFMWSAGMVQRRPSKSNSAHVASRTSWLRTPVRMSSSSANRPKAGFRRRAAMKSGNAL